MAKAKASKTKREAPTKVKAAVLALFKEIGAARAALKCKVTQSTLVALAFGTATPQHPTLVKICKALKLPAPEAPMKPTKKIKPAKGITRKSAAKIVKPAKLIKKPKPIRKPAYKREAPATVAETNSVDTSALIAAAGPPIPLSTDA